MTFPRSYLFVPGDRPDRFDKALASGADRVILDLEDAVAPGCRRRLRAPPSARASPAPTPPSSSASVVRINDDTTEWYDADMTMLQGSGLRALLLPKAERAVTVARVRSRRPGIEILALIESARGVLNAVELAGAPGVSRLVFGTLDFALDLGLSGDPAGFDPAASHLALASRAAGLAPPVAGVTTAIDDAAALRADMARARAHGFGAKLCIHPRQVAVVHSALRPDPAELAWARGVLAAAEGGAGAVQFEGRMVDRPVLERARMLLARAEP